MFKDEKQTFQSLRMKNKLHAKFRDENNSLTKKGVKIYTLNKILNLSKNIYFK